MSVEFGGSEFLSFLRVADVRCQLGRISLMQFALDGINDSLVPLDRFCQTHRLEDSEKRSSLV